jgi:hypothetical protein
LDWIVPFAANKWLCLMGTEASADYLVGSPLGDVEATQGKVRGTRVSREGGKSGLLHVGHCDCTNSLKRVQEHGQARIDTG